LLRWTRNQPPQKTEQPSLLEALSANCRSKSAALSPGNIDNPWIAKNCSNGYYEKRNQTYFVIATGDLIGCLIILLA
jgi:hypothetical protein